MGRTDPPFSADQVRPALAASWQRSHAKYGGVAFPCHAMHSSGPRCLFYVYISGNDLWSVWWTARHWLICRAGKGIRHHAQIHDGHGLKDLLCLFYLVLLVSLRDPSLPHPPSPFIKRCRSAWLCSFFQAQVRWSASRGASRRP